MSNRLQQLSMITVLSLSLALLSAAPRYHQRSYAATLQSSWQAKQIRTAQFNLLSYQPKQHAKENLLTVYIEGDGIAWLTKNTISTMKISLAI